MSAAPSSPTASAAPPVAVGDVRDAREIEATWTLQCEGLGFPEGPVCLDDGRVLVVDIQHGTITVNRTLIPWVRVQHVETQRGVFEQAFDLATVIVHNAAGSHTIPMLARTDAEELRERIAARAKTDDEPDDA